MMKGQFPSLLRSRVALCMFGLYIHLCSCEEMNATTGTTIKIGALVAFNTTIGKVAKLAIEQAVRDVNNDGSLLQGSQLVANMFDTNCSGFQGAAAAIELLKEEVVGIVGPQSSTVSHFIAHMGSATQVPLVSFGATDPTLAESQYPFFFRVAHNDLAQMAAVAAVIGNYNWRQVIALYTDDDYGTNGISALNDALQAVGSSIIHKEAMPPGIDRTSIGSVLTQLEVMESRVFVIHMQQDVGLKLLAEANYLGMMNSGFAWIVTDAITVSLDVHYLSLDTLKSTQGIIGTRRYIPETPQLRSFLAEREKLHGQLQSSQADVYELFAYDSVWLLAHAIDRYLKEGLTFKFEDPPILPRYAGGSSELSKLKIFSGGSLLRQEILQTTFNGTTGPIKLDEKGDLVGSAFEIVNMVGKGLHVIGYWTNATGISLSPPDVTTQTLNTSRPLVQLLNAIWPGGTSQSPKGWVVPRYGKPLRIGVPLKVGFKEIVGETKNSDITTLQGFCIDVFETALKYLPYYIPYKFVAIGNGSTTPLYDSVIERLANKEFDAIVGDITITTERLKLVDFTQHFKEAGLVVVAPLTSVRPKNLWDFLQPFTAITWFTIGAFFLFTATVIWMLEHKMNYDFRGHPKKQFVTTLWFIFSTLFFAQREKTKTTLGRAVLLIWLFVVLIITSSYTASLTSILTVQHLIPNIQGISSLISSDVPIGYQGSSSFVRDYLISLGIHGARLKPYYSVEGYAKALKLGPNNGGIAAIVDELPYAQLFLSTECDFQIAGQTFTLSEWGFVFPKGSQLTADMSTAIVSMSANGDIHRIYELWFSGGQCSSKQDQVEWNQLDASSFWGLFLITAVISFICLVLYIVRLLGEYKSRGRQDSVRASGRGSSSRAIDLLKDFASYVDEPEPSKVYGMKKKRKLNELDPGLDQIPAAAMDLEIEWPHSFTA